MSSGGALRCRTNTDKIFGPCEGDATPGFWHDDGAMNASPTHTGESAEQSARSITTFIDRTVRIYTVDFHGLDRGDMFLDEVGYIGNLFTLPTDYRPDKRQRVETMLQ